MNKLEYQKACSYRVQEALEDVLARWQEREEIDVQLIAETQALLKEVAIELDYFREKLGKEN
jgi:hypothetical protein